MRSVILLLAQSSLAVLALSGTTVPFDLVRDPAARGLVKKVFFAYFYMYMYACPCTFL